jgi:hypothetical protein
LIALTLPSGSDAVIEIVTARPVVVEFEDATKDTVGGRSVITTDDEVGELARTALSVTVSVTL